MKGRASARPPAYKERPYYCGLSFFVPCAGRKGRISTVRERRRAGPTVGKGGRADMGTRKKSGRKQAALRRAEGGAGAKVAEERNSARKRGWRKGGEGPRRSGTFYVGARKGPGPGGTLAGCVLNMFCDLGRAGGLPQGGGGQEKRPSLRRGRRPLSFLFSAVTRRDASFCPVFAARYTRAQRRDRTCAMTSRAEAMREASAWVPMWPMRKTLPFSGPRLPPT